MKKVSIEVGHGGSDPGAVSGNVLEKNINLVVALELERQLKNSGVDVLISRRADVNDKASEFFVKASNYAPDVGVSVHVNAFNGTARGFEVFRNTNSFQAASNSLCAMIEAEVRALGQTSRGIKPSPFLMSGLRCPTAYLELGFLDNPTDYAGFNTEAKQRAFGAAYAKGILKFLGISAQNTVNTAQNTQTAQNTSGTVWRVIAGSFADKKNAEARAAELRGRGIDCFLGEYKG